MDKSKNTKIFISSDDFKIPHMGWNNLSLKKAGSLFKEITTDNFFYFVHSYFISCENEADILTETNYGTKFVSSFSNKNIFGCQFHPEKSHDSGLQILKNFAFLKIVSK